MQECTRKFLDYFLLGIFSVPVIGLSIRKLICFLCWIRF